MYTLELLANFIRIDEDIKDFVVENLTTVDVDKGVILRHAHALDRKIYFVEKGLLRTFYLEDGKDITLSFIKENGFVASKETLFLNLPSANNMEALEYSTVSYLNYEVLQKFADTSISVSRLMVYVLGVLAINTEKRIYALQFMTAKQRYNQLMQDDPDILLRAPLGAVASYLGMTQETLSRIRR
ncbi:MAG TPA: Crp/Fnr family transcriptional regulator [Niabella sp.]|nr:Crp/Fnr family transcriptional regulator [Niabella sp.]HOZ96738.1 Crp/Fnr family transcriptional regulator [Niabella sp.]HQW14785.1 Crp/Fnr family transcriptional regulator [Niabella sp.]HQX19963.1 Crp/Fnr family transcriptional regulator [Niabella sp.]HQX42205.1 Crp/Fnr family transcriptional regulator [Niabella sp.]